MHCGPPSQSFGLAMAHPPMSQNYRFKFSVQFTSGERHTVSMYLTGLLMMPGSTIRPAHAPGFDLWNFCAGVGFWGRRWRQKVLLYCVKKTPAAGCTRGGNLQPGPWFFQLELNPGIKSNPDIHFQRTDVVNDGQSNALRPTVAVPYESLIKTSAADKLVTLCTHAWHGKLHEGTSDTRCQAADGSTLTNYLI